MDPEQAKKVNELAKSLKSSGLASTMQEAVEKAEEILLGKEEDDSEPEEDTKIDQLFEDSDLEKEQEKIEEKEEVEAPEKEIENFFTNVNTKEEEKQEEQPKEQEGTEKKEADFDVTKETKTLQELFEEFDKQEDVVRTKSEIERQNKEVKDLADKDKEV